jgi:hypothetical protein
LDLLSGETALKRLRHPLPRHVGRRESWNRAGIEHFGAQEHGKKTNAGQRDSAVRRHETSGFHSGCFQTRPIENKRDEIPFVPQQLGRMF